MYNLIWHLKIFSLKFYLLSLKGNLNVEKILKNAKRKALLMQSLNYKYYEYGDKRESGWFATRLSAKPTLLAFVFCLTQFGLFLCLWVFSFSFGLFSSVLLGVCLYWRGASGVPKASVSELWGMAATPLVYIQAHA